MGLDINAYKKIDFDSFKDRRQMTEDDLDSAYDEMLYLHSEHEPYKQSDGIKEGFYDRNEITFRFRAGSYSGYNHFRTTLCECFFGFSPEIIWNNTENYKNKNFVELINFSDCEGFIGSKTSKKLFDDFYKNKDTFFDYLKDNDLLPNFIKDNYKKNYKNWMKSFEIASDGGVVVFS
jgi:hypothetical protein